MWSRTSRATSRLPWRRPQPASSTRSTAVRVCDTRSTSATTACRTHGALVGGSAMLVTVTGSAIPGNGTAAAAVLNLIGVTPTAPTYVSVYPTSSTGTCPAPKISTLNLVAKAVEANRVMVQLGPGPSGPHTAVCVFTSVGKIDVHPGRKRVVRRSDGADRVPVPGNRPEPDLRHPDGIGGLHDRRNRGWGERCPPDPRGRRGRHSRHRPGGPGDHRQPGGDRADAEHLPGRVPRQPDQASERVGHQPRRWSRASQPDRGAARHDRRGRDGCVLLLNSVGSVNAVIDIEGWFQ